MKKAKAIGEFSLDNDEKRERALHGTGRRDPRTGITNSGVGDVASEEALLAEYDRLGGLILKDGLKVKSGSFYDFEAKKPREEPDVKFEMLVDGRVIYATEAQAKAIQAAKDQAAEITEQAAQEAEERTGQKKKGRKKKE